MAEKKNPDCMIKIDEIIDDMTQALANAAKLSNMKKDLNAVIRASSKAQKFEDFCKSTDADIKANDAEYSTLLAHRQVLIDLKTKYAGASDDMKQVIADTITSIFTAFNVVRAENAKADSI